MVFKKFLANISLSILFITASSSCFASNGIQQKMDTYLKAWTAEDLFSGAALAAKDGKILIKEAYGKAHYDGDIPNTADTRFRIGSLTKGFTALIVLQLEQKGLLHLSDTLETYLPDYPRGKEITLDMLLNHRSGIVDHTTLPDFNTRRRTTLCTLEETIKTFRNLPLKFTPGTKFEYSSSNYILLGYIIEKVTQKSYSEILSNQIFEPLGMNHSGFEYYQREIQGMASGYKLQGNNIVAANDRIMQNAHASGAIYSTIDDMYIWDRALYTNKLITSNSVNKILQSGPDQYCYGWGKTRVLERNVLAHMGETEGFMSNIIRFVDDNACVIVLSNFEHCPITRISEDLAGIMFGQPYRMPKKALKDPDISSRLDEYVGNYQIRPDLTLTITKEDGWLYCKVAKQAKLRLYPESETRFFPRELEAYFTFVRDEKGNVEKLILNQNGRDFPAQKL